MSDKYKYKYPNVINLREINPIDIDSEIFEQKYVVEEFDDGSKGFIHCIKIETPEQFKYLCEKIYSLEQVYPNTIYRGQSNYHWKLNSSLEREIVKNIPIKNITAELYTSIANRHLENVKKLARGKILEQTLLKENTTFEENIELWAMGQHLHLNTPLIDWSRSFGISLFFAFDSEDDCEYRSVYRMVDSIMKITENNLVNPRMDHSGRLTAQRGLFTYWGLEHHLKEADQELQKYIQHSEDFQQFTPEQASIRAITKYYLSNSLKDEVQKYLQHIGITYETIYPDLAGVIKKANMDLNHILKNTK